MRDLLIQRFAMDLLIGASASVGFISSALSQDASPAIELSWTSTMRSKPMFLKIYRDGRVLWPNRTTALLGKLSPDEVARLLSDIEGTGFFSLDQETINRSIALASGRSYRRRATNQIYPPGTPSLMPQLRRLPCEAHRKPIKLHYSLLGNTLRRTLKYPSLRSSKKQSFSSTPPPLALPMPRPSLSQNSVSKIDVGS